MIIGFGLLFRLILVGDDWSDIDVVLLLCWLCVIDSFVSIRVYIILLSFVVCNGCL